MDLAAHCLQNDLKIKKSPLPPPPYKTAVSWGKKGKEKKKKAWFHYRAGNEE